MNVIFNVAKTRQDTTSVFIGARRPWATLSWAPAAPERPQPGLQRPATLAVWPRYQLQSLVVSFIGVNSSHRKVRSGAVQMHPFVKHRLRAASQHILPLLTVLPRTFVVCGLLRNAWHARWHESQTTRIRCCDPMHQPTWHPQEAVA
jgi:hypothetical protein